MQLAHRAIVALFGGLDDLLRQVVAQDVPGIDRVHLRLTFRLSNAFTFAALLITLGPGIETL